MVKPLLALHACFPTPPSSALFEGKAIAVKIRCGDKSLSLLQILVWSSHFLELSHYQNIRCVLGRPHMSSEGSPCSQEEEGHEDGQNIHKVHLQWDLAGTSLTWGGSHGSRVNCGSLRVTLPSRSYARCRWIRLGGQKEAQAALWETAMILETFKRMLLENANIQRVLSTFSALYVLIGTINNSIILAMFAPDLSKR